MPSFRQTSLFICTLNMSNCSWWSTELRWNRRQWCCFQDYCEGSPTSVLISVYHSLRPTIHPYEDFQLHVCMCAYMQRRIYHWGNRGDCLGRYLDSLSMPR